MAVQDFKERVRQVAIEQAKVYEQVFLRHEYLLCSEAFHSQPYYIISAHADNYRHLVGVNTRFSAEIFFKKCLDGTLAENDFDFCKRGQSEKEVKGAVRDKIIVLPNFLSMVSSSLSAEESFVKGRVHCNFAAADSGATVGFIASDKSKPMTLLRGNRLDPSKSASVDLILRRSTGASFFDEIVYGNERMLAQYRERIKMLLAENLKETKELQPI